jgi:glycosyltransferase involved in cell wall biosynthesis
MTVSVIISAYNRPQYIAQAIQSVLDSTFKDVEIIILNSSDEEHRDAVNMEIAPFIDRVKLIYDKNSGPAHSWNRLIEEASGEFITNLCDDDALTPTLIERLYALMPECELAVAQPEFMDKDGNKFDSEDYPWFKMRKARNGTREAWKKELHAGTPFCGGWMYRKALVKRIGGSDEGLTHLCDLDFYLRVITVGDIKVIEEPLYKFRIHTGNTSWANEENRFRFDSELKVIRRRYFRPELKGCPATLDALADFDNFLRAA